MAEVKSVRPVGVEVDVAFTVEELKMLKQAYDRCEINVDLRNPEDRRFHDYFVKVHAPFIDQTLKDLEKAGMI